MTSSTEPLVAVAGHGTSSDHDYPAATTAWRVESALHEPDQHDFDKVSSALEHGVQAPAAVKRAPKAEASPSKHQRLLSLDMMRGLTMVLWKRLCSRLLCFTASCLVRRPS